MIKTQKRGERRIMKKRSERNKDESKTETKKAEFVFPSRSRCPRCKATSTEQTATKGAVQYRRCRVVVCRYAYKVPGTAL